MFNSVVLSTNLDRTFFDFIPATYVAWRKWFNITPWYAVINQSEISPNVVKQLQHLNIWDRLVDVPSVTVAKEANVAKLARLFVASKIDAVERTDTIVTIHDIDSVPLQTQYGHSITSNHDPNKLLAVGHEAYNFNGKFPMSFITARPSVLKAAINPTDLTFDELVMVSTVTSQVFDNKENPANPPEQFSDESWLRARMHINGFADIQRQTRNVNVRHDWVDRSWWNELDVNKLKAGGYTECNFLRPLHQHIDQIMPVLEYVCVGTEFTPDDLILKY